MRLFSRKGKRRLRELDELFQGRVRTRFSALATIEEEVFDADVVIATRAGLIAYTARFAPDRMIRIGQEHLTRPQQRKAMREELPIHLRKLDAFVTMTARDAVASIDARG